MYWVSRDQICSTTEGVEILKIFFVFFAQLRKKLQMQTAKILFVRSLEPNQFMSCGSQRHVLSSSSPQWSQNIFKICKYVL